MKMIHLYVVVPDDDAVESVEQTLAAALGQYHWDITDIEDSQEDDE